MSSTAVEELRPEDLFDLLLHAVLHAVVGGVVVRLLETELRFILDRVAPRWWS